MRSTAAGAKCLRSGVSKNEHSCAAESNQPSRAPRSFLRRQLASTRQNKRMGTINPSTGESLGEVGWGDADDVDRAVQAAYRGFQTWRALKPLERAKILRAAAQLIRKH